MKKKAVTSLVIITAVVLSSFCIAPIAFASSSGQAESTGGIGGLVDGFELSKPDKGLKADSQRLASSLPMKSSANLSAYAPPIGNQGNQGSCVGWATAYYYKTWLEKAEHPGWDLNNSMYQFSPAFVYNQINDGMDAGATFQDAFQLMENSGCVDLLEFPYDGDFTKRPNDNQKEAAEQYRISGDWNYFFAEYWWAHDYGGSYNHDISGIKSWLNSGKPLVMGIPIYNDFPGINGNPSSSYYTSRDYYSSNQFLGGHAVFIAGYDDNANPSGSTPDTRGGFLLLNSWGSNWNGNGQLWISYKFAKQWVPEAWLMNDLDSTPTVTSINPSVADTGDMVTIKGNNFGSLRRQARVAFPGYVSYPSIGGWNNNEIKVMVPTGIMEGDLYIEDWNKEISNPMHFRPGSSSGPGNYWLLAEGSTWPGFDEWVLIQNPNSSASKVEVTFLTPGGSIDGPAVTIQGMSRVSLHVNDYVPNQDVSTMVLVTEGGSVCCERAMYFQTADGKWGSHDCVAAPEVSTEWYLAEGATWPGFDEWVLIMNPWNNALDVKVSFQTAGGNVNGPTIPLAAGSRYSLHVNDYLPNQDVSTKVQCLDITRGVVAERAMYMNTADGKVGCHNSLGANQASSGWGMAEGATWPGYEEWVLVQNPSPGKSVGVEFFFLTPDGKTKGPEMEVQPGGRISLRVNDYVPYEDVSTMVFATNEDDEIVVERAMYVRSLDGKVGAHNAPASVYSGNSWYLPEGCTSPGFDEWVSVVNPDPEDTVEVNLTFMTPQGPVAGPKTKLAPGSRETFNVNNYVSGDVSTKVESSGYVLCERAMYVSTPDGKTGAHCSLGILADYVSDGSTDSGYKLSGGREIESPNVSELRNKYLK
ncbi:MAG: IPT/TIG domain-containing protein [Actinobacteria bacterium]|nr:IPT/TIG domain-containing protein [Actinomycetota bacterium]